MEMLKGKPGDIGNTKTFQDHPLGGLFGGGLLLWTEVGAWGDRLKTKVEKII